jgi:hypothetical protein
MRTIPAEIKTGCHELDNAWAAYSQVIMCKSEILIPDNDDDLNWHAFLGHSIDMQGFRAAEFAGVDEVSKPAKEFKPLNKRGIGIAELGKLWEIEGIQNHLLYKTKGTDITTTYEVLTAEGGEIGHSLAEAFKNFPFRKGHKYVRALLQNSAQLKEHGYSFRCWLEHQCHILGVESFPPADFRQRVRQTGKTIEGTLCTILEDTFYMVGPEMAPYMLCDWQLWLWKEEKTKVFDTFKLDSFHAQFVELVNARNGFVIPSDKQRFTEWWHGHYPYLPPRLANECIWLYVDDDLLHKTNRK